MNPQYRFDADDPFGTRPDEKPPEGWDERFWEGVRDQIETRRDDPEPPGAPGARHRAIAIVTVAVLGVAAAGFYLGGSPAGHARDVDHAPTVVRVSGSGDPAVAVEWARSGGCRSGYVIFQSLEPDISYVVIDQRLSVR